MSDIEQGEDSPQMVMMQGMQNNMHGDNVRAMEKLAGEMLLEIFTPEQVVTWVVSPH